MLKDNMIKIIKFSMKKLNIPILLITCHVQLINQKQKQKDNQQFHLRNMINF